MGRTPLKMFDQDREPPALLRAGEYVRFDSISEDRYTELQQYVNDGSYELVTEAAE